MKARQRIRRKRREEELEGIEPQRDEEEQEERKAANPAAPADRALELQKTAGNRAVGAALARWGMPWIPATAAAQWPKEAQVILDGEVLPLKSWSWSEATAGTGAASTGAGKPQFNEVNVSTTIGEHSAELTMRTAGGRPFKTVIIVVPGKDGKGITLTFTDVLISGYQVSGDLESWSLSFAKKEFSQSPPQVKAQPRP
jgi:Type VI secretion system effector, Hcp